MNWREVSNIDPLALQSVRVQLHHAVQLPGMFGRSYSPADEGDAFGNLGWVEGTDALVSHAVWSGDWNLGFSFKDFSLILMQSNRMVDSFKLQGNSVEAAISWINDQAKKRDRNELLLPLPYEVPSFGLSHQFVSLDFELVQHVANLYHNTQEVLSSLSQSYHPVEPIRCWPHHFDLATRLILQAHDNPEEETSIGFGFSPGDEGINQPYFYVNCWPYPQLNSDALPDLGPYGQWNLQGWIGTTLLHHEFAAKSDQQSIVLEYFTRSIENLRVLLS